MATDSRIPDNPPAFPSVAWREQMDDAAPSGYRVVRDDEYGMTLRDYFAAHALTWALFEATDDNGTNLKAASITAFLAADAMLAERAKGGR